MYVRVNWSWEKLYFFYWKSFYDYMVLNDIIDYRRMTFSEMLFKEFLL